MRTEEEKENRREVERQTDSVTDTVHVLDLELELQKFCVHSL